MLYFIKAFTIIFFYILSKQNTFFLDKRLCPDKLFWALSWFFFMYLRNPDTPFFFFKWRLKSKLILTWISYYISAIRICISIPNKEQPITSLQKSKYTFTATLFISHDTNRINIKLINQATRNLHFYAEWSSINLINADHFSNDYDYLRQCIIAASITPVCGLCFSRSLIRLTKVAPFQ